MQLLTERPALPCAPVFEIVSTHADVGEAIENSAIDLGWLEEAMLDTARKLNAGHHGLIEEVLVCTNKDTGDVEIFAVCMCEAEQIRHVVDVIGMARGDVHKPRVVVVAPAQKMVIFTAVEMKNRDHGRAVTESSGGVMGILA